MSKLEINLLGGFDVRMAGTPLTGFYSNKARALLCYLAVTGRSHTREALADLLWQDVPERDAKTSLRQVLSNLRKVLGDAIEVTRQTVAIRPNFIMLDTTQFASSDDPSTLDLYRGDFLAGFHVDNANAFDEWALMQRERLRLLAIERFERTATAQQAVRDRAAELASWLRLLEIEPWRESAHLRVMWLYVRQGRLLAALRQFERCKQMLDEELGVAVSAEMQQLAQRIEAVRSRQQVSESASQPTQFVGRVGELNQLGQWLRDPTCRMVTVWGGGGLGKTRLVQEWLRNNRWEFLEGGYFVDLVGVRSAEGVLATLAAVLGIDGPQVGWRQVMARLHSAEILLVFDNFEHLVDHADLLTQLFAAPNVKLLITSRELLNLREEWVLELGGLDYPKRASEPTGLPSEQQFAALTLFAQTAQRQGRMVDTAAERGAVQRLCQMVDGLPLAIELLAAATRLHGPSELVAALDGSMDAVQTRFRNWPARHRSLRAVFEYSWALLDAQERDVLARLAVFVGGFSAESAAAVLPDGVDAVAQLVDKSLVARAGVGRLTLHQTVRAYALEQAAALAVDQQADQAHAHFFKQFAERQYKHFVTGTGRGFVAEMQLELGNLRAAWAWVLAHAQWQDVKSLALASCEFYERRGMVGESHAALTHVLQVVPVNEPVVPLLEARLANCLAYQGQLEAARDRFLQAVERLDGLDCVMALNGLSRTLYNLQEIAAAEAAARRAIATTSGESVALGTSYYRLAAALAQQGKLDEARVAVEESVRINQAMGSELNLAIALHELAPILAAQGDVAAAKAIFYKNLTLLARLGDQMGEMVTCYRLGQLLVGVNSAEATDIFQRGLALATTLQDAGGIARFEQALAAI